MRSSGKLTKRVVDTAHAEGQDRKVFDRTLPGFHLRVKPSGLKSFAIQYRTRSGRQRSLTLGRYGTLTVDEARGEAKQLLAMVAKGEDPSQERHAKRHSISMHGLWDEYITRHAKPKKAPRSVEEDESIWRRWLRKPIGQVRVNQLTRKDVEQLHATMRHVPSRANRMLALLSKMMNLAVLWGYCEKNPCSGIPKYREFGRERFLTLDERERLVAALACEADRCAANAVWLAMLTGARRGEVLNARWGQFCLDGHAPVWVLPASNTKQRRINRKPLSVQAVILLTEWRKECPPSNVGWVFPGKAPEQPRHDLKRPWSRIRKTAELGDFRFHDLRHDFASMAVQDGWSLSMIGQYLGHASLQTTQRYAHLQDDPLRAMAERVGAMAHGDKAHGKPA